MCGTMVVEGKVGGDGDDDDDKDPKNPKDFGLKDKVPKEKNHSKEEEEEKTPEKCVQHTLASTSRVGTTSHSLIIFSIAL